MTETPFEGFALLELMGHRQRIGRIREVEMFGGKLLRIDVVVADRDGALLGTVTEFYGASSVYALRPLTEEVARDMASRHYDERPVKPAGWKPGPKAIAAEPGDDFDEEVDDPGDDDGGLIEAP